MLVALLVLLAAAVYLFPHMLRRWRFVRTLNRLPGPAAYPIIGTTWLFAGCSRDTIHQRLCDTLRPYPSVVRLWAGRKGTLVIKRAEEFELILGQAAADAHGAKNWQFDFMRPWLGNGLLTVETTPVWQAHRRLVTPAFSYTMLAGFCAIFDEQAAILVQKLTELSANGPALVPVYPLLSLLTLDVIVEAAMGLRLGLQQQTTPSAYNRALFEAGASFLERAMSPWQHADWMFALSANGRRFRRCRRVLQAFTTEVIERRRAERRQGEGNGMLQKSASEDGDSQRPRQTLIDVLLDAADGSLSDRELREEVDTFMFTGHDTTTASIAWTLWLLANHPQIQEQVHDEVEAMFAAGGDPQRAASMHDLNEMRLLERVIKESLRLYPAGPIIGRRLSEAVHADGFEVPAGTEVEMHIYALHRDERHFPEANRFDPDRFLAENVAARPAYAYLPFGAGARVCVGPKYAQLQSLAVVAAIVRRFRLSVPLGERVEDERQMLELTLKPARGAPVLVERR